MSKPPPSILALFFLVASVFSKPQAKPNIVLILADDMGYTDLGCFGAKEWGTPNLDRMAKEGMRFTNFHVTSGVCSASRAALLTGCYQNRVGISGALSPWNPAGLPKEEQTIAEILKQQGYATGMVGKWHLGHELDQLPPNHGFDEWLGLPYSNDMWPVGYDGQSPPEGSYQSRCPVLPLYDGLEKVAEIRTQQDQDTLTTRYTERAVDFINNNRDHPFFLYVAHSMPHVPLGVSDKFRGKSQQGLYGDVVMELDWSVGEILNALKSNGVESNTWVIFTSDNGPWRCFGDHAGTCEGLREGKHTEWEGGIRVPCLMHWPGTIPTNATCSKLVSTMEILPTATALAEGKLPEHQIDGRDIRSLIRGEPHAKGRKILYCYLKGNLCAVIDGHWKLVFPHSYYSYTGFEPGKDGFPGKTGHRYTDEALYDLQADLAESRNVAAEHPEVVSRLEAVAKKARGDLGDQLTGQTGKGIRPWSNPHRGK